MSSEPNLHQLDLLAGRPEEFLTIAEAARHVRCCERTIRRAIASGDLRAGRVRAGQSTRGAIRIRAADLDAWLYAEDGGDHATG